MKYKRYTVNVPEVLVDMIETRIPECPYASASSYFLGLAIFDCWSRREHRYTAMLMNNPGGIRDATFKRLAVEFKARTVKSESPGWFDHFVERIVKQELAKAGLPSGSN